MATDSQLSDDLANAVAKKVEDESSIDKPADVSSKEEDEDTAAEKLAA